MHSLSLKQMLLLTYLCCESVTDTDLERFMLATLEVTVVGSWVGSLQNALGLIIGTLPGSGCKFPCFWPITPDIIGAWFEWMT